MLGYLYGKKFGSKIAQANPKEGDMVGAGPNGALPSTARLSTQIRPYPVTLLPIGSGYFRAKPFPV